MFRVMRREDDGPWEPLVEPESDEEIHLNFEEFQQLLGMFMRAGIVCNENYGGHPVYMTTMVGDDGKVAFKLFISYEHIPDGE